MRAHSYRPLRIVVLLLLVFGSIVAGSAASAQQVGQPAAQVGVETYAPIRPAPDAGLLFSTGVNQANGWTLLSLGSASLNAISMAAANDGWIVGDSGFTFHYDGQNWTPVATPQGTGNLNSVSAVPGTGEAWTVGDGGVILHYANGSWTAQTSNTTGQIDAVWMISTTEGWAVAWSTWAGQFTNAVSGMLHYQNGTWTPVQLGFSTTQMHFIQMLSATNGFVVGNGGAIFQYNGSSWQPVTSNATNDLYAISLASAADGWAVGDHGTGTSTILHYTGGAFAPYSSSPVSTLLWATDMISSSEGWATGNGGTLIHYVNGAWVADTAALTQMPLYGIAMVSASEGWAVGSSPAAGQPGVLLHYTGGTGPTLTPRLWLPAVVR